LGAKARANYGTVDRPPVPPSYLSAAQVETINQQLAKQNWRIIKGRTGVWGLVRVL
jgi:hypothetical protein